MGFATARRAAGVAGGALLLIAACGGHPTAAGGEDLLGPDMPYATFARLPHQALDVPGGVVEAAFAPGPPIAREQILAWVRTCATIVAKYYGRFPVARERLLIVPVNGNGVRGGTSWAVHGAATRIIVGSDVSAAELDNDWMLVHEFIHLALPTLADEHHWLEEGLATYVEPAARAATGHRAAEDVWREWVSNMPKGLPRWGDRGLDRTHTWARTYWGGALFCLLADVDIRKRTHNAKGLRDALRGILAAGGNMEDDWPIEKVIAVGDNATGTTTLADLYAKSATEAYKPDLDALWRDLGVELDKDTVIFDDKAPLASTRKAITAPLPSS